MNENTHFVIGIQNKIPYKISGPDYIVTDNSDYTLELMPDAQWDGMEAKTILYAYDNGTSVLRPIIGNADEIPMIQTTGNLHIGVTAGEMKTSTWVSIPIKPSIRKKAGTQIPPPAPGVYDQIIGLINKMIDQSAGKFPVDVSIRTIIHTGQPDEYVLVIELESGEELTETLPQMGLIPDDVVKIGSGKPSVEPGGNSSNYKQFYIDRQTSQLYIRENKEIPEKYIAVGGFLAGDGEPSRNTVASVGNIYLNTATKTIYRCTNASYSGSDLNQSIFVTWEKIAKIPTKTSELENDAGFITKAVEDLAHYYKKSETLSKEEINALVLQIPKFSISVVDALPTSGISTTTIYLVKSGSGTDLYTEYIYTGGAWEILGSQRVDLTGYATEAWVNAKIADFLTADKLTAAMVTGALGFAPAKDTDVPAVDSTLKVSGAAADAKAVGDKVNQISEAIADFDESKADGIIESATGEVIAVSDSVASPLRGLVVYGKSTQDGTPTPDAPVPIVSVGGDGVTDVQITGKNMFGGDVLADALIEKAKGTIDKAAGTVYVLAYQMSGDVFFSSFAPNTQYTFIFKLSTVAAGRTSLGVRYTDGTTNWLSVTVNGEPKTVVYTSTAGKTVRSLVGGNYSHTTVYYNQCGIFEGVLTADDFEPYRPAQTLPISTPGGLCGIPVTDGGNYTNAAGQQWICDTVDFVRGVRVQRVGQIDSYSGEEIGDVWMSSTGELTTGAVVLYPITDPIETPLTESELAAYKALYTNHPNTTIYADDNAGLAVQYKADTKLYIDKKFDALAAAIVNNA